MTTTLLSLQLLHLSIFLSKLGKTTPKNVSVYRLVTSAFLPDLIV